MHAVLFPLPDSTELYVVARGDGTHISSKGWEDHLAAIAHVRAVARVESATTFAGPMPPPSLVLAAPDSTARATRAEIVSAPSRNGAGAEKREVVSGPKKEVVSGPKKKVVSGPKAPAEATKKTAASSARKKEAVNASRKKPLHPAGPPAPEGTASSKHKKRAAKP